MAHFDGFCEADFETLEGSSWRGRDALGGALKQSMRALLGKDCQSWGVTRRVELHVAKKSQYDFYKPRLSAKLFVYSYEDLSFGFYVEGKFNGPEFKQLRNFKEKLNSQSTLRKQLELAIRKHHLEVSNFYSRATDCEPFGRYNYLANDGLTFTPPKQGQSRKTSFGKLFQAINDLDPNVHTNLHVYANISKKLAIAQRSRIVSRITKVMVDLAPVYLESIS